MHVNSVCLRVLKQVEEEIGFVRILSSRVKQIEQNDLVEIVSLPSVVREEEVRDDELQDLVCIDLLNRLVDARDVLVRDFHALLRDQDHTFNHLYALKLSHASLGFLSDEFDKNAGHISKTCFDVATTVVGGSRGILSVVFSSAATDKSGGIH